MKSNLILEGIVSVLLVAGSGYIGGILAFTLEKQGYQHPWLLVLAAFLGALLVLSYLVAEVFAMPAIKYFDWLISSATKIVTELKRK